MNLLCKPLFVDKKIFKYAKSKKEYVRRTAFTLIACLAFKDKELKDKDFIKYFDLIEKYSFDERNFVKKAVN
jgi:3-methyladenine DNA glycosylase AlkD